MKNATRSEPAEPVLLGHSPSQGWLVTPGHVDMTRPPRPVRPLALDAEPQSVTIDASKTALLVVDMQNDFCTTGGWLHSRGIDVSPNRAPIAPLKAMIEACRGAGIPVVWVNWGVRKDLLNIAPSLRHAHNPRGDEPGLAEPVPGTRSQVIARGSWGAEVVDEINPGSRDHQVTKHRFSAFWDCETDSVLRNLGVTTLLIGGVNMDQCVMTTLEDASFLGYDTILLEDCTATTSPRFCVEAVLYNVKLLFGFVARSATVLEALAKDPRPMTIALAPSAEKRLAELGVELPAVPRPIANFVPWRREGGVIYLAGQVCEWNGRVTHRGKVGDAFDMATAQEAARICALNLTAALREALGHDLDRVRSCLRLGGFVNCVPDFPSVPQVINGASDFFHALFGSDIGAHARTAIGVAQLPQGAAVEVDAIFAVR